MVSHMGYLPFTEILLFRHRYFNHLYYCVYAEQLLQSDAARWEQVTATDDEANDEVPAMQTFSCSLVVIHNKV